MTTASGRARRSRWSRLSLRTKGLVVVSLPLAVVLVGLAMLGVSERQLRGAEAEVARTLEVRAELIRLRMVVRDADAAVAGGLLTGSPDLVASVEGAPARMEAVLAELRRLVRDPQQRAALTGLEPLLKARLDFVRDVARLPLPRTGGPPSVPRDAIVRAADLERPVANLLDRMDDREQRLLQQRTRRAETTRDRQLAAGLLAGAAGLGGALAAMLLFTRGLVRDVRRVELTACRIQERADLPPLEGGEDELGRLERTLHSTAERLAENEDVLRREADWLAWFVAVQQSVTTGALDTVEAASRVARATTELLGARGCTVELLDDGYLVCCAAAGDMAAEVGRKVPLDESPAIPALATGRLAPLGPDAFGGRRGLAAPLLHGQATVGALTVTADADVLLSAREVNAIELLAGLLGVTIGRAQAREGLAVARDEADAANRAKSEFLSRMSHELRTPLNAILGFGQLLRMDSLSEDQQDSVEQILRGGRHLLDLVNEVLDISRIEAGRLQLSMEPVDLRLVLSDCVDLMRPLAASSSVSLPASVPSECDVTALADRQRLKQALLNLLSNAVKYNRRGGDVFVTCRQVGDRARIDVADTGIGIADDALDRLFVPFERLSGADSAVEGTGLGLALAKRLVEAMGGSLGVDSSRQDGTTFTIELQAAPASSMAPALPDSPRAAPDPGPRRPATVLYIEDNPSNVRLVERILELRKGVRLATAPDGLTGLELASCEAPDVVFLDLHLPDMDGIEVLRRLKADEHTARIPVVVVSADATDASRSRLLRAGADEFLAKPLDVVALLEVVDSLTAVG